MQLEKIIEKCLEGNEGAWRMLVNTYSKRIFNIAYQFSGKYEEAEDVTQEIFLKLHYSLSKYDFNKNFSAWLLSLTRNHLIDQYRKTKWKNKTRDEFNEYYVSSFKNIGPEESILKNETRKFIWEGFKNLSSEMRIALILRDIQGKKYKEVAEIMSLPLGTVKSRVNRGRLQLARILKEKKEERNGM